MFRCVFEGKAEMAKGYSWGNASGNAAWRNCFFGFYTVLIPFLCLGTSTCWRGDVCDGELASAFFLLDLGSILG